MPSGLFGDKIIALSDQIFRCDTAHRKLIIIKNFQICKTINMAKRSLISARSSDYVFLKAVLTAGVVQQKSV
jgi:hypothetical protein